MEKKIYYTLGTIVTVTALITSIVIVILLNDYYSPGVETVRSIKYMFLGILPAMVGILVFILLPLYLISSILTDKIIQPIKLATQNIESILSGESMYNPEVYEELKPFIQTIELQKKQIEYSIKKLKRTEEIRRDFTANVSHELKTPLTSINGYAEVIETGIAREEEIIKAASIIKKEGNRLLELIDNIIQLSQLEDLTMEREFTSLDIFSLGKSISNNLIPKAKEKNITLDFTGNTTVINGNKRMIEDLLYNIIDNSIKYNVDNGKVHIHIYSKDKWGIIKIQDTGIGIPGSVQDRVFERFYRVDKSRSKKIGGTGLGLSIVKHIVEYHNGRISLSSTEDKGTTVEVCLPK